MRATCCKLCSSEIKSPRAYLPSRDPFSSPALSGSLGPAVPIISTRGWISSERIAVDSYKPNCPGIRKRLFRPAAGRPRQCLWWWVERRGLRGSAAGEFVLRIAGRGVRDASQGRGRGSTAAGQLAQAPGRRKRPRLHGCPRRCAEPSHVRVRECSLTVNLSLTRRSKPVTETVTGQLLSPSVGRVSAGGRAGSAAVALADEAILSCWQAGLPPTRESGRPAAVSAGSAGGGAA